jgi:ATP-dependent DNA helicase RecQ
MASEVFTDQTIEQSLSSVFGLSGFRVGQAEAVGALLEGRDLLAVMPTGAGKSLCFQLPAVVHAGLTVVVSPLIALMKDQVDGLKKIGVRAEYLASSQTAGERSETMRRVRLGEVDLLYVSPERLRESSFINALARLDVWLVAVDEAHCISTWGTDFRPDYLRIPDAIARLPRRPVIAAFTATATPGVRDDLIVQLGMRAPERVLAGFDRPNLRFLARYCRTPSVRLRDLSAEVGGRRGSGIIYAGTRKATEEQAEWLRADGRSAVAYHAGLPPHERTAAQDAFLSGEVDVIVATNAFGMGIDKPDVRFVIHTTLPPSPDAYYQEAGRAGRDGLPADALLLYTPSDRGLQEWLIDQDLPDGNALRRLFGMVMHGGGQLDLEGAAGEFGGETSLRVGLQVLAQAGLIEVGERAGSEQVVAPAVERFERSHVMDLERALAGQRARRMAQLEEMIAYAESSECRRAALLGYFGDPAAKPGGVPSCCDICARPDDRAPGEIARLQRARKLLQPKHRSKMRQQVHDALVEHGTIPGAARALGMEYKKVGELARTMVSEGQLDVDDVIPAEVQEGLEAARLAMDEAGLDYLNPRPGYLQSAMGFCPPGTSWDHLAMYLAHRRRQQAIDALGDVDMDELETFDTRQRRSERRERSGDQSVKASSDTATQTLELFLAGQTVEEIAEQRELKPITVEGHLVAAIQAGRLDVSALVDNETAAIVREAIAQTPPSDTPLRDIRATAQSLAGRDVSYVAINAVRAAGQSASPRSAATVESPPRLQPNGAESAELRDLLDRKAKAERLRARHEAEGKPWPEHWDAEYRRIVGRIEALKSSL